MESRELWGIGIGAAIGGVLVAVLFDFLALRPLTVSPTKVFKSGRTRGGRLIRTLATLLFSVVLLSALVWVLIEITVR